MAKDYLNEYRKEIRKRYEVEKKDGNHVNFLVNPSPANLRELCVNIFRDNKNTDDFVSFRYYFGFDYTIENVNELNLQNNLNKFVPIGRFLKGESELKSIHGLDLAAMLVNFKNRPFNKFKNLDIDEVEVEKEEDNLLLFESEKLKENDTISDEEEIPTKKPPMIIAFAETKDVEKTKVIKKIWVGKLKYVVTGLIVITIGFFGVNHLLSVKECMQWQNNHYELVDCDIEGIVSYNDIVPVDPHQLKLIKIKVDSNTVFFKGNDAIVFYCKVNGEPEFFNQLGKHPETGQALKDVTDYIINKYVKPIEN